MEWIDNLNNAIRYIEDNITEDIDYRQLSKIACCSEYHFQRMFSYMAGVPLSVYIRRRRMSLAAVDLQDSDAKVIDIAEKYGYNSPTAFNRAFQSIHGIAPSAARSRGVEIKSYPPLMFTMVIKGVEELNYRIENMEAFRIVGISEPIESNIENNFQIVPEMWEKAAGNGTIQKLAEMIDSAPFGLLGVSACNDEEQWKYFIAVSSTKDAGEFDEYVIPAMTWAVFPGEGTFQSIQELERRVVTEWLPGSGYEYANAPDVEVYMNADPENAKYEVWIPVTKKS